MKIGFGICESELLEITKDKKQKKEWQKLTKIFNTIQIMLSPNPSTNGNIGALREAVADFEMCFIHASYQINMANPLMETENGLFNIGMEILLEEIGIAKQLGAKGIVLHVGKNTKNSNDIAVVYNNMIMFVIELFDLMKKKDLLFPILLETPAGQSGDLLYDIGEFVDFVRVFQNADFYGYLNICIDTCHIFQAGIDINNDVEVKKMFAIIEPVKNKVKLIHLNDSKNGVGEGLDRHERIGFGKIKTKNLKTIVEHFDCPIILETNTPYEEQIENYEKA
jgi:deoxyribonuclease-4